jgi:ankyrin repeat protein
LAVTLGVLAWSGVAFCGEIHEAVMAEDVEKVKLLLKNTPSLANARSKYTNFPPLHLAVIRGNTEIVAALLAAGADVNAGDDSGKTPLHLASSGKGTRQNATEANFHAIFRTLIEHKADINRKDNYKRTPLHDAALRGEKTLSELLLNHGADVNVPDETGDTPLHDAIFYGSKDVVRLLLDRKADLAVRNKWGKTPLGLAIQRGHKEVAEILRKHGAKE